MFKIVFRTNYQLQFESTIFNDIIQLNFKENYYNLTLKTIAALRWTALNCPLVKFMLKLDSDIFLRPKLFLSQIKHLPSNKIYGRYRPIMSSRRNLQSKWYIDPQNYPYNKYPAMCVSTYFIPGILTLKLYQSIIKAPQIVTIPALPIEDNYMGILAEKAKIPRKQFTGLKMVTSKNLNYVTLTNCSKSIFYGKITEKTIKKFWNVFKTIDYQN